MAGKHRADAGKASAHATLGHDLTQPLSSPTQHLNPVQMAASSSTRDARGYPNHSPAPAPAQPAPKTMGPQHEAQGKRPDSKPYASTKPGKHRTPSSEQNVTSADRGKHAKPYSIERDIASTHDAHKTEYTGKHSARGMAKSSKLDASKASSLIKKAHGKLTSRHSGKLKGHLANVTK
jgi:hypothetical protein